MTNMIPTFHIKDLIDFIGPDKFAGFHRQVALRAGVMRKLLTELLARREAKPVMWRWRKRGDPVWNVTETEPDWVRTRLPVEDYEIESMYGEYKL